jgi:hypothetical protein
MHLKCDGPLVTRQVVGSVTTSGSTDGSRHHVPPLMARPPSAGEKMLENGDPTTRPDNLGGHGGGMRAKRSRLQVSVPR